MYSTLLFFPPHLASRSTTAASASDARAPSRHRPPHSSNSLAKARPSSPSLVCSPAPSSSPLTFRHLPFSCPLIFSPTLSHHPPAHCPSLVFIHAFTRHPAFSIGALCQFCSSTFFLIQDLPFQAPPSHTSAPLNARTVASTSSSPLPALKGVETPPQATLVGTPARARPCLLANRLQNKEPAPACLHAHLSCPREQPIFDAAPARSAQSCTAHQPTVQAHRPPTSRPAPMPTHQAHCPPGRALHAHQAPSHAHQPSASLPLLTFAHLALPPTGQCWPCRGRGLLSFRF